MGCVEGIIIIIRRSLRFPRGKISNSIRKVGLVSHTRNGEEGMEYTKQLFKT